MTELQVVQFRPCLVRWASCNLPPLSMEREAQKVTHYSLPYLVPVTEQPAKFSSTRLHRLITGRNQIRDLYVRTKKVVCLPTTNTIIHIFGTVFKSVKLKHNLSFFLAKMSTYCSIKQNTLIRVYLENSDQFDNVSGHRTSNTSVYFYRVIFFHFWCHANMRHKKHMHNEWNILVPTIFIVSS